MCHGGDDGSHESRDKESPQEGRGRHKGEHKGVVAQAPEHLGPKLALEGHLQRIEAPQDKEEGHGDGPEEPLVLARRAVVLRIGSPDVEGGIRSNVLVDAHLVGTRVVRVVLVRPPCGAHTPAEGPEGPHDLAELAPAVRVVVREPASNSVGNTEHHHGSKLHRQRRRELREADTQGEGRGPRPDVEQLLVPLPLKPPVVDELLPPCPEVTRSLRHLRHPLGRVLGLGQALHHVHALVRVEAIHDLSRILILVEIDPVGARRVSRAPPRKVIPLIVDAHEQLPLEVLGPLPQLRILLRTRRDEGWRGNHPEGRSR
mmetsp:Transcript_25680/g.50149  ORF Transcript_25680/g.50149 Transcript_25680/m.50149 type:complete len:315 (-) Transcript_25680:190-1134(-)